MAKQTAKRVTKATVVQPEVAEVNKTKGRKSVELNSEQLGVIKAFDKSMSTSEKIRALTAAGWTRSQIAKGLNILYQHVRNVQITPLKKG